MDQGGFCYFSLLPSVVPRDTTKICYGYLFYSNRLVLTNSTAKMNSPIEKLPQNDSHLNFDEMPLHSLRLNPISDPDADPEYFAIDGNSIRAFKKGAPSVPVINRLNVIGRFVLCNGIAR